MKNMIETELLTKYYGKSRGIIDLDLAVEEGEFFGFIGPNGAGKSTTIRLLLSLIKPTSGNCLIFGKNIEHHSQNILENIGYIPSEAMFYNGRKVSEIIQFSAALRKKDCSENAAKLCERLQLDPDMKIENLSLGNRKKAAIVCALQHDPDLLIFDEPTSGLDPLIQREFFEILKEENNRGATIFFSSHILSEVQRYCNRAAVIRDGRLAACGDIETLTGTNTKRISVSMSDSLQPHQSIPDILPARFQDRIRDVQKSGGSVSFLFSGNIKELLGHFTGIEYTDLTVTEPDLNEIFMHYYETGGAKIQDSHKEAKGGISHDTTEI